MKRIFALVNVASGVVDSEDQVAEFQPGIPYGVGYVFETLVAGQEGGRTDAHGVQNQVSMAATLSDLGCVGRAVFSGEKIRICF